MVIVLDKPEKDGRIYYAVSPQALSDENECTKTAAAPGYDYASTGPVTVRKLLISSHWQFSFVHMYNVL